jgi:hypothetical protein
MWCCFIRQGESPKDCCSFHESVVTVKVYIGHVIVFQFYMRGPVLVQDICIVVIE